MVCHTDVRFCYPLQYLIEHLPTVNLLLQAKQVYLSSAYDIATAWVNWFYTSFIIYFLKTGSEHFYPPVLTTHKSTLAHLSRQFYQKYDEFINSSYLG